MAFPNSQIERHFCKWSGGRWSAVSAPGFADFRPPDAPWGDTEKMKNFHGAAKIQPGREVIRLARPDGDIFIKHYIFRTFSGRLRQTLAGCRARFEFDAGRRCLALDIRTGEPVWTASRRSAGIIAESFLVTRAVDGIPLEAYFDRLTPEERPAFLAAAGREVARMHGLGFYHDDLKGWHMLAAGKSATDASFAVIDLHGCRFGPLSPRQRANNLFQVMRSLDARIAEQALRRGLLDAYRAAGGPEAALVTEETIQRVAASKAARRGAGALKPDTA
jgi:tRNA A-37 threonylcarbamoyl transferase component Bud32